MRTSFIALTIVVSAMAFGCDKLKGTSADGGAGASGGSSGILGDLFEKDFEGEITMKLTQKNKAVKDGPQQIVFGVKKPKYRLDTSGQSIDDPMNGGSLIIDLPTKKGYMLIHPQKMAMVLDFEKMKNGQMPAMPGMKAPKGTPTTAPKTPPTVEKTGKKDTVAGYTCEIWNVTSEGKKSELCVADGITWIDLSDLGMSSPEITLAAVASDANRFPLRVIMFDAKGAEELRMEAQKVDKKKLDDARFVVPPDYRVLDMSAIPTLPGLPGQRPPVPKAR